MFVSDVFRWLGPVALLVSLALAYYLLVMVPTPNNEPISYLATHDDKTRRTSGWYLGLTGWLLFAFGVGWLVPHYALGLYGQVSWALILLCLLGVATVPVKRSRWATNLHRLMGYGLSVLMMLVAFELASSHAITLGLAWVCLGAGIAMGAIWMVFVLLLTTRLRALNGYFLHFELAYVGIAELMLLAASVWH